MNYNLNQVTDQKGSSISAGLRSLLKLISHEQRNLIVALGAILLNSLLNLLAPFLIGYAVDHYIQYKKFDGVLVIAAILLAMYALALFTSYFQTMLMGGVGQRLLFTLRNAVFNKLQTLPVAFFNANKAGDLISRVNNDTDKLNTFFSQSLMGFVSNLAIMTGAGIFLLAINIRLGLAALAPALCILVFTKLISPWMQKRNAQNLTSVGGMSAEIQESLNNFRVIIAFNRRDYFKKRFEEVNLKNYETAIGAGLANNLLLPVYSFFSGLAQLIVLVYGIYLISESDFTIGFLVSYLAYAVNFYNPLRQLAALWTTFQVAMAGWDRIDRILVMENNLVELPRKDSLHDSKIISSFRNVRFGYQAGTDVLQNVSFSLERGKTYAFVGPTGGGKSTTAALIARLFDPTEGIVELDGRDIRTYSAAERARKVGFILQEPFLFTGSMRDNILYGNETYARYTNEQLEDVIRDANLQKLLDVFDNGLNTQVSSGAESISLGQKQLIAFIRAVLRRPEILILDEATANIDTVTEQLLGDILKTLPDDTTRIVIAHRLNTIQNADEIFFVNGGEVVKAGSFQDAMDKLLTGKRAS